MPIDNQENRSVGVVYQSLGEVDEHPGIDPALDGHETKLPLLTFAGHLRGALRASREAAICGIALS